LTFNEIPQLGLLFLPVIIRVRRLVPPLRVAPRVELGEFLTLELVATKLKINPSAEILLDILGL